MLRFLSLGAVVALLTGCVHPVPTVGTDFHYPTSDQLSFGRTTPAETESVFGKPHSFSVNTIPVKSPEEAAKATGLTGANDGKTVTFQDYLFAIGAQKREMAFIYADEKLSSFIYLSNFPNDSSDFDEGKVGLLKKGVTTESEAISYFGKAPGRDEYPAIHDVTNHALKYVYVNPPPAGGGKDLTLLFDKNGILVDFKFNMKAPAGK